jgi:tRNA(Ile)-lysidine synthase
LSSCPAPAEGAGFFYLSAEGECVKMLLEFEKKVAVFIKANGLFVPEGKILLAISGGADSTALLYAMCAIKADHAQRWAGSDILCAHINHQLRGAESDGDEAFVVAQANKLNLPVITRCLDVRGFARENKLSIETAARKLRIESLLDIAKDNDCRWVVTAHQKDDSAETIIQRLIRGTGFRGLASIWPIRNFDGISFVRPLLCVGRDEIIEYLSKRSLNWREDHTNANCTFRRNFIRHKLLPALQRQCSGSIVEQLFELSRSAQKFYDLVCSSTDKIWPQLTDCAADNVKLELNTFLAHPFFVKIEIIRRSLTHLGSGEKSLTHQHYEKVLQLAAQNAGGKTIDLPDGFVVWREYGNLIFARYCESSVIKKQPDETIELQVPGQTQFGCLSIEATILEAGKKRFEKFKQEKTNFVEWFDLDNVKLPIIIRFRRPGDRFWPLGSAGEKKVGKFLTAAKVPQQIRKKILIVTDSEKIIWVWPIRMSEQAKVTGQTRKVLQLKIIADSV